MYLSGNFRTIRYFRVINFIVVYGCYSFQNWTFGVELGVYYCSQLSQLFFYFTLLSRKDCLSKPHRTRGTTDFAPAPHDFAPTTHAFTPITHDLRLCTHDPRLLVTPGVVIGSWLLPLWSTTCRFSYNTLPSVFLTETQNLARHVFNSSTSMFSISFEYSCRCWNHSVEQIISQKLLKVPDTLKQKK